MKMKAEMFATAKLMVLQRPKEAEQPKRMCLEEIGVFQGLFCQVLLLSIFLKALPPQPHADGGFRADALWSKPGLRFGVGG